MESGCWLNGRFGNMMNRTQAYCLTGAMAHFCLRVGVAFALLCGSFKAYSMWEQTEADLRILEDALQNGISGEENRRVDLTPMLVATPMHLFVESKSDFAPAVWSILKRLIPNPGDLIQCTQCNGQRLHMGKSQTISIESGELSLNDLVDLSRDKRYQGVKSIAFTKETPSGVEVKILRITDGAVLFQYLADGRLELSQAKPKLGIVKEYERRERGESLSYIFIDLGVYPSGLFHISFLEQWGSLNQHISGLTLSLVNPEAAVGASYRYMLPFNRQITASAQVFFPVTSVVQQGSATQPLSGALGLQSAISSTFGVFIWVGTKGAFSAGFSLYNPILFPFML